MRKKVPKKDKRLESVCCGKLMNFDISVIAPAA
jgi:hypothetical protein